MKGKPGKTQSWLPNQVAYGVDCSDPDPEKWKPFGSVVEDQEVAAARKAPAPAVKVGPPAQ